MVLSALTSSLLLFITLGLGFFTKTAISTFFKTEITSGFFEIFLLGLIMQTVYFNILSLWVPVNYILLLPLFIIALYYIFKQSKRNSNSHFLAAIKTKTYFFFEWPNVLYTTALGCVILYRSILPCNNFDSGSYHYASIWWYENYKAIPGLANVHGRFGFNPASFIIQAAYSFSAVVKQPIYPLNKVVTGLFMFWLLNKFLQKKQSAVCIVYFISLFIFKRLLAPDLSSPSSDSLVIVCTGYVILKLTEVFVGGNITMPAILNLMVILLYSLIVKLSAFPLMLLVPTIIFFLPKQERGRYFLIKFLLLGMVLYIPWLLRNVILSGYLIYPVPFIDIFHVDWKVPKDELQLDYILIRDGPKDLFLSHDFLYMRQLHFVDWFLKWAHMHFKNLVANLIVLSIAFVSPLFWVGIFLVNKSIQKLPFVLWVILYASIWEWLLTSPEYRFGLSLLWFVIFVTGYVVLNKRLLHGFFMGRIFLPAFFVIFTASSLRTTAAETSYAHPISLKDYWLYPLKDKRYFYKNDKNTFPYTMLNSGVKLYLEDSTHECLNADGPCMSWRYGQIEMRGNKIEDGFRNIKDEVKQYYPFVK